MSWFLTTRLVGPQTKRARQVSHMVFGAYPTLRFSRNPLCYPLSERSLSRVAAFNHQPALLHAYRGRYTLHRGTTAVVQEGDPQQHEVVAMDVAMDDSRVMVMTPTTLTVVDAVEWRPVLSNASKGILTAGRINPWDPQVVAAGTRQGALGLWDSRTTDTALAWVHPRTAPGVPVNHLHWLAETSLLVASHSLGSVAVYDSRNLRSPVWVAGAGLRRGVAAVSVDRAARLVWTVSKDSALRAYAWGLLSNEDPLCCLPSPLEGAEHLVVSHPRRCLFLANRHTLAILPLPITADGVARAPMVFQTKSLDCSLDNVLLAANGWGGGFCGWESHGTHHNPVMGTFTIEG